MVDRARWQDGRMAGWQDGRMARWLPFVLLLVAPSRAQILQLNYTIVEEPAAGTFIGNVFRDTSLSSRSGVGPLTFRYLTPPSVDVRLDPTTGVLRSGRRVDRDRVCAGERQCVVTSDIVARTEPAVNFYQVIRVLLRILDINDHWPEFAEDEFVLTVSEATHVGAAFPLPLAGDPDSGPFAVQRYSLVSSNDRFNVSDGLKPRLMLVRGLDREHRDYYRMKLQAYDGGIPPKSGALDIRVHVKDSNDNAPRFLNTSYRVVVPENIRVGSVVTRVFASDSDSGSFGRVSYAIDGKTRSSVFDISNSTGEIHTNAPLDFETRRRYELNVIAQDGGVDSFPVTATVTIVVQDINDNAPVIAVNTLREDGRAAIREGAETGTFVAHVTVNDPDEEGNAAFNCALDVPDFALNELAHGQFTLLSTRSFDRELTDRLRVTITCADEGSNPHRTTQSLYVDVTDVNDHAPVFDETEYRAVVTENNRVGESLLHVHATDDDSGSNSNFRYELDTDAADLFEVGVDGVIRARMIFDRESTSSFSFNVRAIDSGTPSLQSSARVVVDVKDVNDEAPSFSEPFFRFLVFENEAPGAKIGRVLANDRDAPPNGNFTLSIRGNITAPFRIGPRDGTVHTTSKLDREKVAVYHVTVLAIDEGMPSRSSSVLMTISVLDRNDNAPVFVFPNADNSTLHVPLHMPLGHPVGRILASDADSGSNANLTYAVASEGCRVDPVSGELFLRRPVERPGVLRLDVQVRDDGDIRRTGQGSLNIVFNASLPVPEEARANPSIHGHNLTVVLVLATISAVIMVILLVAIAFIRRQDVRKRRHNYNCRTEALKYRGVPSDLTPEADAPSSRPNSECMTTVCATSGCLVTAAPRDRPRKEVSFCRQLPADSTLPAWPSDLQRHVSETRLRNDKPDIIEWMPTDGCGGGNETRDGCGGGNVTRDGCGGGNETRDGCGGGGGGDGKRMPTASARRPWSLTPRELEVHELLELLKRDQDADSAYSGDGSNTDSGRGPSDEDDSRRNAQKSAHNSAAAAATLQLSNLAATSKPASSTSSNVENSSHVRRDNEAPCDIFVTPAVFRSNERVLSPPISTFNGAPFRSPDRERALQYERNDPTTTRTTVGAPPEMRRHEFEQRYPNDARERYDNYRNSKQTATPYQPALPPCRLHANDHGFADDATTTSGSYTVDAADSPRNGDSEDVFGNDLIV